MKGDLLPIEFRKYARPGTLSIVNGYVLDVPNSELETMRLIELSIVYL